MSTLDELRRSVGLSVDRSHHDRFGISHCVDSLRSRGLVPHRYDYPDDLVVTDPDAVIGYCLSLEQLTKVQTTAMRQTLDAEIAVSGSYRVVKETALVVAQT
jgi:hypothetical protein